MLSPWRNLSKNDSASAETKALELTSLSAWEEEPRSRKWNYISPRYKVDRTITCPNSASYGCLDLWGPDLFAEFAGVCSHCGYHFPMEPDWYVKNVFEITADPADFDAIAAALEEKNIETASAEVTMVPDTTVKLEGKDAEKMLNLVDALEEHDDVQNVYANYEVDDE